MCCALKDKEFSWKIERKDPNVLFNELYEIFTKKLNIISDQEKFQKQVDFINFEKSLTDNKKCWTKITKKTIRNSYYEHYAIKMQNKYNLKHKEVKQLLSLIKIGINFKAISSKDIYFDDGEIQHIDGIIIENDGKNRINFSKDIAKISETNTETKKLKKTINDLWIKYLDQYNNSKNIENKKKLELFYNTNYDY